MYCNLDNPNAPCSLIVAVPGLRAEYGALKAQSLPAVDQSVRSLLEFLTNFLQEGFRQQEIAFDFSSLRLQVSKKFLPG